MSNDTDTVDSPPTELVAPEPMGLQAIDRQEIDIQIATAKRYPRVVSKCLDRASDMLTMDVDTAESAFYELPAFRGSKETIIGPSIRCAEIIASAWGNIEYGSYPLEITDSEVRACGFCRDRENNISFKTVKSRPIKDKYGKTYAAHLITKTMLAAQAIAERDAICKVIPRAYVNNLYKKAVAVADGKGDTLEVRVQKLLEYFAGRGVTEAQVMEHLEVADKRDITSQQLGYLRGVATAIKEGTATVKEVFGGEEGATMPDPQAQTAAPVSADQKRESLLKIIAAELDKMPAQELRDEAIKKVRVVVKEKNNGYEKWGTDDLVILADALVKPKE